MKGKKNTFFFLKKEKNCKMSYSRNILARLHLLAFGWFSIVG